MAATTMHFGPEWMRTKHQSTSRAQLPESLAAPSASTYSALAIPAQATASDKRDETHPFRYTKEDMLRIYRENGGKSDLGLEVERWEGVVREVGADPVALRDMSDAEKKLFAGPLNSELRRRQSTDFLSPLATQNVPSDRPRLNHSTSSTASSPLRERFLKRRESTDQQSSPSMMRKHSLSILPQQSPREGALASPRTTRGFEGVLSTSDSTWTGRRRASDAVYKAPSREVAGDIADGMPLKEVDETRAPDPSLANSISTPAALPSDLNPAMGTSSLHLQPNGTNHVQAAGPSPGITDIAAVEWSYLDPQGQVQGPFRADLMQKWHDDGYFTPDLPMRRTHIDHEWTPISQLQQQAMGEKLFLSPPRPPPGPPGLSHSPFPDVPHPQFHEHNAFANPYQPVPLRTQISTLDSYIGTPLDSPSSSLGGTRFSNESPDPYGGRTSAFSHRVGNFPVQSEVASSIGARRNAFNDAPLDLRSPSHTSMIPTRGSSADGFAYNSYAPMQQNQWQVSQNGYDNSRDGMEYPNAGFTPNSNLVQPTNGNFNGHPDLSFNDINNHFTPPVDSTGHHIDEGFNNYNLGRSPFGNNQQPLYGSPHRQPNNSMLDGVGPRLAQLQTINQHSPLSASPAWGPVPDTAPEAKRPGPFDPVHPTSANTVPLPGPWSNTSQTVAPVPTQPASNDVAQNEPIAEYSAPIPDPVYVQEPTPPPEPVTPAVAPAKKLRTKAPKEVTVAAPPVTTPVVEQPPVATSAGTKPAWAKDDEPKKPSGVSLSLRDIQEAEAKKAEARKVAEREREKAARAVAATNGTEDSQSFVASWGLPTSQAGVRVTVPKDATPVAGSPATPTGGHSWASGPKAPVTVKKTMKEIQEEEERRKKTAAKEPAAAAITRRGYADSTAKVAPAQQNSAWATIGPSGKAIATPVAARPAPTAASVVPGSAPRPNGLPARPAAAAVAKPVPASAKVDDKPVAPSHDFLKWLNNQLKDLNSAVNVEDIMSMLLSFSMDPDPSTVELISDLIYANSTMMDGRRFASEFVAKRKADAAARPKGAGVNGVSAAKPVSIADVLKAQPKPAASSEWGGFKVVNKKKKGGRS